MKIVYFFLLLAIIVSCSKDDDSKNDCECETITFRAVINQSQGQYDVFNRTHCVSYWEQPGFVNLTIDKSTSPTTITGPNQNTVNAAISKFPCN